jgi:hypothetical protein
MVGTLVSQEQMSKDLVSLLLKQLFECVVWMCAHALLYEVVDSKFQVRVVSLGECVAEEQYTYERAHCTSTKQPTQDKTRLSTCCSAQDTINLFVHATFRDRYTLPVQIRETALLLLLLFVKCYNPSFIQVLSGL